MEGGEGREEERIKSLRASLKTPFTAFSKFPFPTFPSLPIA